MSAAPAPASSASSTERLGALLEGLELTPMQKEMLRQRWLDQVTWMGRQARRARSRYRLVRVPVVVGGVLIPALISILLAAGDSATIPWLFDWHTFWFRVGAFVVSLVVALLAATEESFRFAEQWRHYRRTAELLKTLGWQYLSLSGTFKRYRTHADAFTSFTERVEDVLNEDVEGYLTSVSIEGGSERRHDVVT